MQGASSASLVMVIDDASTIGGKILLLQLASELSQSIVSRRSTAGIILFVASCSSPKTYQCYLRDSAAIQYVDCFRQVPDASHSTTLQDIFHSLDDLNRQNIKTCVVIDDLSRFASLFGFPAIAAACSGIAEHACVISVLTLMHQDLHAAREIATMESAAHAWITLQPPQDPMDSQSHDRPHGTLRVCIKRSSRIGRLQVENCNFWVRGPTTLHLSPQQTPQGASSVPSMDGLVAALMKQMGGGMQLTLTEKERSAKKQVVLPYEKVTQQDAAGSQGQAGQGAEEPPTVTLEPGQGAKVAGSDAPTLGVILYTRDSEEELDSDHDPDDDLDI